MSEVALEKPNQIPEIEISVKLVDTPRFSDLGEYYFQDLCRDLYFEEDGIDSSEFFGVRGQKQHGTDIIATLKNSDVIDLVQCKAFKEIAKKDVSKAVDVFFKSEAYWKDYTIRKFVIIFGCTSDDTSFHEEIKEQKKRLGEKNILFEVWTAVKIRQRLSKHFGIVTRYIKQDYWVENICGKRDPIKTADTSVNVSVTVNVALASQLEQISALYAASTGKSIDYIVNAWREGKQNEVLVWIKETKGNGWNSLTPELQARILRLDATIKLDSGVNLTEVEKIADEAKKIHPESKDLRLRALILLYKNQSDEALALLEKEDDVDSANLKVSILMNELKFLEASVVLEKIEQNNLANAESYRLLCTLNIVEKKIDLAQVYLNKAVAKSPNWESIKFASLYLEYHKTISPCGIPKRFTGWPEAIDWTLVKTDKKNIERINELKQKFLSLSLQTENEGEKLRYTAWAAACALNLNSSQEEGTKLLSEVLEKKYDSPQVVVWILNRNLKLPIESYVSKLEKKEHRDHADLVSLVMFYFKEGNFNKAVDVLQKNKNVSVNSKQSDNWKFWLAQSYAYLGKGDVALKVLSEDQVHELEIITSIIHSQKNKNQLDKNLNFTRSQYKKIKSPFWLYEYAISLHKNKKWKELSEIADKLVVEIQTFTALGLGLDALYFIGEYQKCLDTIENFTNEFKIEVLPHNIRIIRLTAMAKLGKFPNAIKEAEILLAENNSTANLYRIFQLYHEKGDNANLEIVAIRLGERNDLKPRELLQISYVIQTQNKKLARTIFEKINLNNLSGKEIPVALSVCHSVGANGEDILMKKMSKLANRKEHGVFSIDASEIPKMLMKIKERNEKINEAYRKGRLAVHSALPMLNGSLAQVYHQVPQRNIHQDRTHLKSAMLFFFGGLRHVQIQEEQIKDEQCFLDVTALLNAKQYGYLNKIEEYWKKICISPKTLVLLAHMKEQCLPTQQKLTEHTDSILSLIGENLIKITDVGSNSGESEVKIFGERLASNLLWADQKQARVLDFYPPTKDLNSKVSPEALLSVQDRLTDIGGILKALLDNTKISQNAYSEFLSTYAVSLGLKPATLKSEVRLGDKILISESICQVLEEHKLLEILVRSFEVYIDSEESRRLSAAKSYEIEQSQTLVWIDELVIHINQKINKEKYIFFPDTLKTRSSSLEEICLHGLLDRNSEIGDLYIVDDRSVNSYTQAKNATILSSLDLLNLLEKRRKLSTEEKFLILSKMRQANLYYVMHDAAETYYYLRRSTIVNNEVVETFELALLRKYFNGLMVNLRTIFQNPGQFPEMPNPKGELGFLVMYNRSINDLILDVWKDETTSMENKKAYSEWIWGNLYVSNVGLMTLAGIYDRDLMELASVTHASLVFNGLSFKNSEQKEYFDWIEKIIYKKTESHPLLLESITKVLKVMLDKSDVEWKQDQETLDAVVRSLIRKMPDILATKLKDDEEFSERHNLGYAKVVNIDDMQFMQPDFWDLLTKLIESGNAEIKEINTDKVVHASLKNPETPSQVIAFKKNDGAEILMRDKELSFLRKNLDVRAEFAALPDWFDTFDTDLENIMAEFQLATIPEKLKIVRHWKQNGMQSYYNMTHAKVKELGRVNFNDLIPQDLVYLLKSLRFAERIEKNLTIEKALERSLSSLNSLDFLRAFYRASSLPIALPEFLLNEFKSKTRKERKVILGKIMRHAASPVASFHLIKLLYIDDQFIHYRSRLLKRLTSDSYGEEIGSFLALLSWVSGEFLSSFGEQFNKELLLLLSWSHASNLFAVLKASGVPMDWIKQTFSNSSKFAILELLKGDDNIRTSCLHPSNINKETFFFKSVIYSCPEKEIAGQSLVEQIGQNLFYENPDDLIPKMRLLDLYDNLAKRENFYLSDNVARKFAEMFQFKARFFDRQDLEKTFEDMLNKIESGAGTADDYFCLAAYLETVFSNIKFKERVHAILRNCDFKFLYNAHQSIGVYVIRKITEFTYHIADEVLADLVYKKILELIRDVISKENNLSNKDASLAIIIDCVVNCSAVSSYNGRGEKFLTNLLEISEAWPDLQNSSRLLVDHILSQASPQEETFLWKGMCKLRS